MKLTEDEEIELIALRERKQSRTMFFPRDLEERLKYLVKKTMHNSCSNPHCTGYEGTDDETECPICHDSLFKTLEPPATANTPFAPAIKLP